MVKKILYVTAGVALLILGALLGGLFDRRRVHGVGGEPVGPGPNLDGAGAANTAASGVADSIEQSNSASQKILQRSRDLLAKAKARSGDNGG